MISERSVTSDPKRMFAIMATGQLISTFGSRLVTFGMGVWIYQQTGSSTQFAFILLLGTLSAFFVAPVAGVLVDRWDRRLLMIGADVLAASCSLLLAGILFTTGRLEVWHIYTVVLLTAMLDTVQTMAFYTSIPLLVPKEHLGRASGIMRTGNSIGQIIGPLLAGTMLVVVQLQGLLVFDIVTFVIGIVTLLIVRLPALHTFGEVPPRRAFWQEAGYGFTYIRERVGLFALLGYETVLTFFIQVTYVLFNPLMLNFNSPAVLGTVVSVGGVGGVLGGLLMSTWGGPKRRMYALLGFPLLMALGIALLGFQPSLLVIGLSAALLYFCVPIFEGCKQALWQTKVAPAVQGRVFAAKQMTTTFAAAIAYVNAGLLADQVFEPLLQPTGLLAGTVGQWLGVGPGRGIGFFYICVAILIVLLVGIAYLQPRIRQVEAEIPDAV